MTEKHESLIKKAEKLKEMLNDLHGKYHMLRATTSFTECLQLINQLQAELTELSELTETKPRTAKAT